ncbi:sigma-54-dependent Fis family transcriptional regulator [Candidatus Saganbacteria bacterium]|nr:sigma-54-dependent Fis family transcriptional regulator [Candidatus Saganbacteria bacterium]
MTKKFTILVVDDEKDMLKTYENILKKEYRIIISESGIDALQKIERNDVDLVISDIKMPQMDGIELLKHIKEKHTHIDVIMATASKDVASAVQAMKLGAYDYINKPFDVSELKLIIERSLEKISLVKENIQLKETIKSSNPSLDLIGHNKETQKIRQIIKDIAPTDSTVLITGESGSGKEIAARLIHNQSNRKNNPFVAINCAAIPENLLESELFGYERGAFTGAMERRIGKFELADSGTLFLDEIGCMSPTLQSKLLRIIEDRKIERLGGNAQIDIDVRIVAATNIDFEKTIKEGKFREDLYYRLNVIPIKMLPLRDRKDDLELFINFFIGKFNKEFNKNIRSVSPQVYSKLRAYNFPGNVRELQNLLERAVALTKGNMIEEEQIFGLRYSSGNIQDENKPTSSDLKDALETFEKKIILNALAQSSDNQTKAAAKLGIARTTLSSRLLALGIRGQDES